MKVVSFLVLIVLCLPGNAEKEEDQAPKPVKLSTKVKLPESDPAKGEEFLPPLANGKRWFKDDDRVQHALHWDGYGEHHSTSSCQVDLPGVSKQNLPTYFHIDCVRVYEIE